MSFAKANYLENMLLNGVFRTATFTEPSQIVVALLKTLPSDDAGTGLVEIAMTGYSSVDLGAPADADWSSPSAGTQGEVDNVSEIDFGTWTAGGPERVIGVAIYNETAKTNLLYWGAMANNWREFVSDDADETFHCIDHGLSVDDRVFLRGPNLSTGSAQNVEYFVGTAPTADTFTLSTTASNGAPLALTTGGGGMVGDSQAKDVANNDAVKFAVGALNIQED
jgi:hypothetical protein